jgi:hypothetical protein
MSGMYRADPVSCCSRDKDRDYGAPKNSRCASFSFMCNRRKYVLFESVRSDE